MDSNGNIGCTKKRSLPDPQTMRRLLKYEPETGHLFWRARDPDLFSGPNPQASCKMWNKKFAGQRALCHLSVRGYLVGSIKPHTVAAHRAAFAILYGRWPDLQIDHINGDRADNRASNLREVTNAENSRNTAMKPNNKSGVVGVFMNSQCGKWAAQICVNGRGRHLGLFNDIGEAIAARKAAERESGFHENHGRQSGTFTGLGV